MSTDRYDFTEREFQLHNSGAKLLYISSAKYNGDWYSFPHTHNFTEVFYVIGGAGKFQIRDSYYKVSVGDMVILNPNIEHTETSMVDDPLEYIVLGIRGIKMSAELDPKQDFSIIHFNEAAEEIQRYLLAMLQEAKNKKNDYEEVCGHLLDILLICLMRQTNITSRVQEADLTHQNKAAAAKEYIDAHFREDIALDQQAQKIQVNKYYLAHIFSQSYGMSPIQYVQTLRLEESKYLLRTTDFAIKQIASITGFSSLGYFSQRFSKAEGMSPAKYRVMAQNKLIGGGQEEPARENAEEKGSPVSQ